MNFRSHWISKTVALSGKPVDLGPQPGITKRLAATTGVANLKTAIANKSTPDVDFQYSYREDDVSCPHRVSVSSRQFYGHVRLTVPGHGHTLIISPGSVMWFRLRTASEVWAIANCTVDVSAGESARIQWPKAKSAGICGTCKYYSGSRHLRCTPNPGGPRDGKCGDWES